MILRNRKSLCTENGSTYVTVQDVELIERLTQPSKINWSGAKTGSVEGGVGFRMQFCALATPAITVNATPAPDTADVRPIFSTINTLAFH